MKDLIIIGSGPAGLSAAVYAKRAGLDTLVIEKDPVSGGQILITYEVDNYLGLPGINGFDMGMKFREHADKLGVEFAEGCVSSILMEKEGTDTQAPVFKVVTDLGEYETKSVILATGASHNKLGIKGEEEFTGRGVSYCATCDGAFFRNKVAVVNGGGDVAVEDAIFLARGCSKVYLVHRRDELRAAKILQDELLALPNVEVIWDSVIEEVKGDNKVTAVSVKNVKTGETQDVATDALFVAIGIHPLTESFSGLCDMDESGYIIADESGATSTPGIFVAGDSRKKRLRQIVTAVADGANAVTSVQDFFVGKK
ncbi:MULTISPECIES: thioredoxin-disulfide reductase [unclassified Butyrivibrio]|uniref:thioredoxin-disulfide reductase n=1 Tax=unclassified Butyrivibrio TaxID=2639466 RepID=UPI0003B301B7|nr:MULTISPECIES: thioredoxin-disulfide reductase [unclassified Butyrivibrio]SDB45353.1 thioredoxin reductase (NADPH) [Butyrivibrio sp. INlla16]SEK66709.1 thioredoxin reductase (NADPH) [Butyrivibrio sp. ob235]